MTEAAACAWCERAFTPRASGGHAQRFCRSACRRAFDAAGRRWVADAISGGMLTVELLRGTASGTRALLPGVISPVPVSERRKPASAPAAPAERPDDPGKPVQLRTRRRSAPPVSGGHRKRQHLGHRPRVDPKTPRRFPLAHTFDLNGKTHPSVKLHALHPPALAAFDKGHLLPDFYSGATGPPGASVRDLCSGAYRISGCAHGSEDGVRFRRARRGASRYLSRM